MKGHLDFRGGFLSSASAYCGVKTRDIGEVSVVLDRLRREESRDSRSVGCSVSVAS